MWLEQKTAPWRVPVPNHPEFDRWRLRVFLLRARMLSFVQQILAFATFEVLEPNWRALEVKLTKVTTVDQLLRDHTDFLDTCLKESMLTSSKLLRASYCGCHLSCSNRIQTGIFEVDHHVLDLRAVHQLIHSIRESCPRRCRWSWWWSSHGKAMGVFGKIRDQFQSLVRTPLDIQVIFTDCGEGSKSTSTVYSFMRLRRMCHCSLSLFDSTASRLREVRTFANWPLMVG